jgi:hypothetical protein
MPLNPKSTMCLVQTWTGWKTMTVDEVLETKQQGTVCIECKKPVQAHQLATNGMAAHFEHREKNASCSLSDQR